MGETLKAQVVTAVSAFLDDPQSLEVRLAPAQPLNFMLLAAAAPGTRRDDPDARPDHYRQ